MVSIFGMEFVRNYMASYKICTEFVLILTLIIEKEREGERKKKKKKNLNWKNYQIYTWFKSKNFSSSRTNVEMHFKKFKVFLHFCF